MTGQTQCTGQHAACVGVLMSVRSHTVHRSACSTCVGADGRSHSVHRSAYNMCVDGDGRSHTQCTGQHAARAWVLMSVRSHTVHMSA